MKQRLTVYTAWAKEQAKDSFIFFLPLKRASDLQAPSLIGAADNQNQNYNQNQIERKMRERQQLESWVADATATATGDATGEQTNLSQVGLKASDASATARRFDHMKSNWGYDHLLPLETFNTSNGFLDDNDSCVLGVELSVPTDTGEGEYLSIIKGLNDNTHTWTILNFSDMDDDNNNWSPDYKIGGYPWSLLIYVKGYGESTGKSISLYLYLGADATIPEGGKLYAEYKLKMKNHFGERDKHWVKEETTRPSPSNGASAATPALSASPLLPRRQNVALHNTSPPSHRYRPPDLRQRGQRSALNLSHRGHGKDTAAVLHRRRVLPLPRRCRFANIAPPKILMPEEATLPHCTAVAVISTRHMQSAVGQHLFVQIRSIATGGSRISVLTGALPSPSHLSRIVTTTNTAGAHSGTTPVSFGGPSQAAIRRSARWHHESSRFD
ncbi:hypothetical protein RJ640_001464 [Escallonia rubra]|uniref:MATH domain-containing protein n=1 Tax=Escallonia rubra TaxID=112253 RepID=A0AA88U846_9ASTE|nr:hypothetical protein RJ640_001464 [Escallonia rubra]